jgi:hypothetical protein
MTTETEIYIEWSASNMPAERYGTIEIVCWNETSEERHICNNETCACTNLRPGARYNSRLENTKSSFVTRQYQLSSSFTQVAKPLFTFQSFERNLTGRFRLTQAGDYISHKFCYKSQDEPSQTEAKCFKITVNQVSFDGAKEGMHFGQDYLMFVQVFGNGSSKNSDETINRTGKKKALKKNILSLKFNLICLFPNLLTARTGRCQVKYEHTQSSSKCFCFECFI